MKTKFYAIMSILFVLILSNSCKSDNPDVREAAIEHFSKAYNIDGSTKVDSVIFLNSSIPQLVLEDESFDKTIKVKGKAIGEVILMMALANKNTRKDNEDEFAKMLANSIKPLKNCFDSINRISTPKQSLALVQVSTTDTLKKKVISKCIYILGNSTENPISDSIIISEDMRTRAIMFSFSQLDEIDMNITSEELEDILRKKCKDPILEFVAKKDITTEKW